ncbi:band 7 family-domain-containing protein [Phascolomyces articulosus]|uniref:Band 7 family-domain-containing protein n=1 Tax=Phascolomyces articulosus TaxID=60185 RepID=A0AAD5JS11_9FUNG|nr:band 7 family-domain-containing protein [Phascolomyces articulosus]
MESIAESSNSQHNKTPYPPYTDEEDGPTGITKSDVEQTFANDYGLSDIHHGFYGSMMTCIGDVLGLFGSIPLPCCVCFPNPYKRVRQGTAGLVTRFGKCYKVVDPGLVKINPVTESIKRVDVTIQITDIPTQEVITKDNVSITIESVMYWRVLAPYDAEYRAEDLMTSLMERARTVLRNVCGQHSFQDLIENRDAISREIQKSINPVAQQWGVEVEATLVKDIGISKQLQQSLSSAATAKRLGESRVIASQAEVESAKLMREAADILSTPAAMQIRYLDTLTAMSRSGQGPKTIFMPMPGSGDLPTTLGNTDSK